MARKVLADTYYSFTPSTRTIVLNQIIQKERFVLITNMNTNQVIYNFSDPNMKITSYSTSINSITGAATTTIVLQYNTASMSASDELQIVIDEAEESFKPAELYTDPVNKFRVSQPQALIDTDFEYSTQSTKWETLSLINNRPYAYQNTSANTILSTGGPITVTAIAVNSNSSFVTVYTANTVAVNTPIFVTDTSWGPADGTFMVDAVIAGHMIRYTTKQRYINTSAGTANVNINIPGVTSVANGSVFSRSNIGIANINFAGGLANGVITTTQPHGLSLGNEVILQGTAGATNAPNGTFTVTGVYSNTTFRIDANIAPVGGVTVGTANLFSAGRSTVVHRAYDGGVEFGTAAEGHNNQLIRQTRRYFRYQSGKGIQMSTGTLIKPAMRIDSITSSGTLVTVRTKEPHFIDTNTSITISNCNESAYNGVFPIYETIDPYTFRYVANSTPSSTVATGLYRVAVNSWYGAQNRVGMFDDQNGIFFEYDGTTLYAVRRSSTFQLSGYISANTSNTQIDGVITSDGTRGTKFTTELDVGDYIVIKGMSYRVIEIQSDTRLHISPAYRGESQVLYGTATKTIDYKIPQSQWNIDKCDGTGPSGYNLDLGKMQMLYLDYSWYGAGFVRWGFRGTDGNIIYCHKMVNNNVNYEAYMRSGNLPGRYETNTFSRRTKLQATLSPGDTSMNVANASTFPTAGTLWVYGGVDGRSEFVTYNGISNNSPSGWTFNNLLRGQPGATINCVMSTTTSIMNLVAGQTTVGIQPGMFVTSANIPSVATVVSINPNVSIQLSQAPRIGGTGLVTFAPIGNTAQTFTYSANSPISVELHAPGYSPRLSHWGTSVIMDGRYDDDKSFVFTQGTSVPRSIPPGQRMALQSFRISPSVNNGVAGSRLGEREIINRMQMILRSLGLLSGGQFLIEIILNGSTANATPQWASVGGSSLAQYINHGPDTRIDGGEVIYGFFTNSSGGSTNLTTTSVELKEVRDLGNSILGGGTLDPTRNFYPDGPDIITICARNVGTAAASIYSRLSWTEAQA